MWSNGNQGGAGSNSSGAAPAIDVPTLLDRCMDDSSLAGLLLSKFEEQARTSVTELSASVGRGDVADAARKAHALKGTAGAIAAESLMNAAAMLEEAALRGVLAEVSACQDVVGREMDRCLASVAGVKQTLSGS